MNKNKKKGLCAAAMLCFSAAILSVASIPTYAKGSISVSVPVKCVTSQHADERLTYSIRAEAQSDGQIIQNNIIQLKNDEKDFFNIEYLCPGTYKYEIQQFPGVYDNIDYDKRKFNATVFVSEDNNGEMNASLITYEEGSKNKSNGATFVNKVKSISNSDDDTLLQAKKDAIESLTNIVNKIPHYNFDKANEILKDYINKINAATSKEEVKKLYEEAKGILDKFKENPNDSKPDGSTNETNPNEAEENNSNNENNSNENNNTDDSENISLEQAKNDAIDALTNIANNVPSNNSDIANGILHEYINKINAATSKEEIDNLYEEGKRTLMQLGGSSNNSTPNVNSGNTNEDNIASKNNSTSLNSNNQENNSNAQTYTLGSNNAETADNSDIATIAMALISSIGIILGVVVATFKSKRRNKK